jgi:vacuolar-type H+-ATPase subunit E/Vma4|tara:strand:- start:6 stop:251 length:246 start_codon:yes stop_codon:yes gene_type:complete
MSDIKELSKSEKYLLNLDMDKLVDSVNSNMDCPAKMAEAIAKLISAKIYLEIVCEEEDMMYYIDELETQLKIQYNYDETIH